MGLRLRGWTGNGSVSGEITASFRMMLTGVAVMVALTLAMLGWLRLASEPEVTRLDTLVAAGQDAHAALVDQETGLRAYVATGQAIFLQPYSSGLTQAAAADNRISRLSLPAELAGDVLDFRLAQQQWATQWAASAAQPATRSTLLNASGQPDTTRLAAFFASGKTLMDAYRGREATLIGHGRAALAADRSEQQRVLLGFCGALVAIAAALAGAAVGRERALRARVAGPLACLLTTVRAVARGELAAPPELAGATDVVALREGIAEMTAALAEQRTHSALRREAGARGTQRLHEVLAFAREISGTLSLRYALDALTDAAVALTTAEAVRVWLLAEEGDGALHLAQDSRHNRKSPPAPLVCQPGQGTVGRALLEPQICRSYDTHASPAEAASGEVIALQLTVGARVIGVLELHNPQAEDLEEALTLVETVAGHAATAVEAARLYEQAQSLSLSDALTGLANRRQLDDDLRLEIDRALRYGRPLALLMMDLDHFKALNDTYGHPAGDAALQQVANVLTATVRGCDSVYRYGGEEIAVLARDTDLTGGGVLAERLRAAVENYFTHNNAGPKVTLSAGVAAVPQHAASPTTLTAAADHALYQAKAHGRNRIAVASETG